MKTVIRKAMTSDTAHLIALACRTISESYRPFLGDEAVDAFVGGGAVDAYVEENLKRCSVILREDEITGFAVWREDLVDLMMIDHGHHRRGLGTKLLRHLEASLFQHYDVLRLESFAGNDAANSFYRKNGWREVGRYFDGESSSDKLRFEKLAM